MTENENGGMAFARLFSHRRGELNLSVIDIAARTGRPIEVVVAWDQGRATPDAGDLAAVAETLKLPQPLLKEALRLVVEHRQDAPPLDPDPDGSLDRGNEPVTTVVYEDEPPIAEGAFSDYAARARELSSRSLRTALNMLTDIRQSISRRRQLARAPVAQPSYVEDRDQLLTYRLRMVFTTAGVAALALILRWSLGGLGSAIADLWKALTGAL